MISRERVLKALNHEEPDRVPVDLAGSLTNAGIAQKAHSELKFLSYGRVILEESSGEVEVNSGENDAVIIPKGYHPNVAAPGCGVNFIWMMAGIHPDIDRKWAAVGVHNPSLKILVSSLCL